MAVEVSKSLDYGTTDVTTSLGTAHADVLLAQPVLATILRAGLPMHEGVADVFDRSEQAFVSACRKYTNADHDAFEIGIDAVSAPPLAGKTLIVTDPMLATGASLIQVLPALFETHGVPAQVHIVAAIASEWGLNQVAQAFPHAHIWAASVDAGLNDKGYIVPGLGDDVALHRSRLGGRR